MSAYPTDLYFNLTGDTRAADEKLQDAEAKLRELTERVWTTKIDADDKDGTIKLKEMSAQLDKLSHKVARPSISIEGIEKADLQLDKLDLKLDLLSHKSEKLHETSRGIISTLSSLKGLTGKGGWKQLLGLLGGNGSSEAPEGAEGAEGLGDFLMSPIGAGLIGTGVSLVPGAVGLGIGGATGIGGLIAALTLSKSAKSAGTGLLSSLEKTLLGALNTQGTTGTTARAGNREGGSIPTPSFITGLDGILKQIGQDVKTLGPDLAGTFRASLPFLSAFASILEQTAKIFLPAFTQTMHQMVSSGALKEMSQGLVILVQGLARFMIALGPALKPSADVFRDLMMVLDAGLDGLGRAVAAVAQVFDVVFKTSEMTWKVFFDLITGNITGVENAFDSWRHDTSAILVSMGADLGSWQHGVSHIFDDLRHDVASTWDHMWSDIKSALDQGVHQDVNFVKTDLIDALVNDVKWLGSQFLNLGKSAMTDLWNGIKSVGDNLLGWAKSLLGNFVSGIKHFFGISSPSSVFHDIGANLMQGLANGIEAKASAVTSSFGRVSANVGRWTSTVQEALKLNHLPLSLTAQVLHQIQTESGGNPMAINLSDINAQMGDPSRGLLQTIGTTFSEYHIPGTSMDIYNPLANVAAAIDYAKHVYGPTLMRDGMGLGSGRGYASGGWITEPIMGVGLSSGMRYSLGEQGPEYVSPAGRVGGNGGDVFNINFNGVVGDPREVGLQIVQTVRRFKKQNGNQPTGIG